MKNTIAAAIIATAALGAQANAQELSHAGQETFNFELHMTNVAEQTNAKILELVLAKAEADIAAKTALIEPEFAPVETANEAIFTANLIN